MDGWMDGWVGKLLWYLYVDMGFAVNIYIGNANEEKCEKKNLKNFFFFFHFDFA